MRAQYQLARRPGANYIFQQARRSAFTGIDDTDTPYPYPHLFRSLGGDDYALTCEFKSSDDEKLYGMGQYQQDRLNAKGCIFELRQKNTQVSIPFVYSSKGYGFLWHNPAIGKAVFANNRTT